MIWMLRKAEIIRFKKININGMGFPSRYFKLRAKKYKIFFHNLNGNTFKTFMYLI